MIIRDARAEDATAVAALLNPVIRDTAVTFNTIEKTPEMVAASIAALPCFLVAEAKNGLLGYVSYDQFRAGVGYERAMEHSIVIAPEARGQGAGRALMTAAEDRARAAGVGSLWAGVSGENPDGYRFHASLNYTEMARLPRVGFKFGRWLDLILMRKWLQEDEHA